MRVFRTIRTAQRALYAVGGKNHSLGFVPTMGALHEGHASLIRQSMRENDFTAVSIFVNPIQFGRGEDYACYPGPLRDDLALCRRLGVDFVFVPKAGDMFPRGFQTSVSVRELSEGLCALQRPGHFTGVATVVAMLFNIVGPDNAYFGQKDAQQAAIIKRMAGDLRFPVKVRVMPTIREKTGLALSSRNRYLSKSQREDALVLSEALRLAQALLKRGQTDVGQIKASLIRLIRAKKSASIDYVQIVDEVTLRPLSTIKGRCLLALAVRIGKTRLIDNVILTHEKRRCS